MDVHLHPFVWQLLLVFQVVRALDTVALLDPPQEALPDLRLDVLYSCDRPAAVQLEAAVSFHTGATSTHLLRRWPCLPGSARIRRLTLELPDWLVYRPDGIVPDSHWVLSCVLRASVRHAGLDEAPVAQDVAALQPRPPSSRPAKQHRLSLTWSARMLQVARRRSDRRCPVEKETVDLLSSVYASTGEGFGIIKTLEPYGSPLLEHNRVKTRSSPWCMFTIWLLVSRHCQLNLCGLFYRIDPQNDYVTPTVLLTQSGRLHVQMTGESAESAAFVSTFKVPVGEWCQLGLMLQGRAVTLSMACTDRTHHTTEYIFPHDIVLDDTEGYFVIGGGKYIRGVEGYLGPVVYYRNRIPPQNPSAVVIPDVIRRLDLTGWLRTCQKFSLELSNKLRLFSQEARRGGASSEWRLDAFQKWRVKDSAPSARRCELWEEAVPHAAAAAAARLAQRLVSKRGGRGVGLPAVGRALFSLSLHKLSKASDTRVFRQILPLLLQAGCLAHQRALHMASVLYSAGLGVRTQPSKALLLALLGAQKDDRLALQHLGHLHQRGLQGAPPDPDLAYAYYANIAQQTSVDRHNPSPEQTYVEAVYLNDEEALALQTHEEHHIFQWLKLQARRGEADAEQTLARMLFWGQQGVAPNIQRAVRHYERGAVRLGDPNSMYDYGIVLLQGHGVERDVPKALTYLEKAKEQGFVPAITALGWYYEQFEGDYARAVQLWEEAHSLGSPDAALNLGVMYSLGRYPGHAADQHAAYGYYLKAAEGGSIRGALVLAEIWSTGIPGRVPRRPSDAVLWAKWVAEHSGYLGSILRRGLDSYLKSDILTSLFYYLLAAEMGYAAAQCNVAYLCEQNAGGFLEPDAALQCMRKYYNATVQNQDPHTYALIKMGDLWYDGSVDGRPDVISAAQMYKRAALRNEPQGWYNLGVLVEEGHRLPLRLLMELGLSELHLADGAALQSALYRRCRDSEDAASFLPCSLALFNLQLRWFQRDYGAAIKYSTAIAAVAAPTIVLIFLAVLRGRGSAPQQNS